MITQNAEAYVTKWTIPVDTCREEKYRSLFKPLLDSALLHLQDDPSLGTVVSSLGVCSCDHPYRALLTYKLYV